MTQLKVGQFCFPFIRLRIALYTVFISIIYLRKARKLSLAMGPSSPHSVYTSCVTLRLVARQRT